MVKKIKSQTGQAIILVVLMMVVALTVGLAVSTRTTTDISMSRKLEQSQRAFSAAEAGIEMALLSPGDSSSGEFGTAKYRYVIKDTGSTDFIFPGVNANCSGNVCEDDSFQFLLNDGDSSYGANKIKIAWGLDNNADVPAMEVAVLYQENGTYKLKRWTFDRQGRNGFSSIADNPTTIAGTKFKYSTDLEDLPAGAELIRGKVFYTKNNQVGFKSLDGATFPKQGKLIESTGTAEGTTRKIEVFSGSAILPGMFDQAIFSKDNLSAE